MVIIVWYDVMEVRETINTHFEIAKEIGFAVAVAAYLLGVRKV